MIFFLYIAVILANILHIINNSTKALQTHKKISSKITLVMVEIKKFLTKKSQFNTFANTLIIDKNNLNKKFLLQIDHQNSQKYLVYLLKQLATKNNIVLAKKTNNQHALRECHH